MKQQITRQLVWCREFVDVNNQKRKIRAVVLDKVSCKLLRVIWCEPKIVADPSASSKRKQMALERSAGF